MTEYLKGRFSVPLMGGQTYRDNWDAIFGKKKSWRDDGEDLQSKGSASPDLGGGSNRPERRDELTSPEALPSKREALRELTQLTEEFGGYAQEIPTLEADDARKPELPPGHVRFPGGGVRKPRRP